MRDILLMFVGRRCLFILPWSIDRQAWGLWLCGRDLIASFIFTHAEVSHTEHQAKGQVVSAD